MTNNELVAELRNRAVGPNTDLMDLAARRLEKATRRLAALSLLVCGDCDHEDDC